MTAAAGSAQAWAPALAEAVARAEPAALLPVGRAGEAARLDSSLALRAALDLGSDSAAIHRSYACVLADRDGHLIVGPLVLDHGSVRRAVPGDGASASLSRLLCDDVEVTAGFELVRLGRPGGLGLAGDESAIAVDQTHESVVVAGGADAVVKWAVHIELAPCEPPAVSALRHLHAAGFTEMATPYGFLLRRDGGSCVLLASLTHYLPGAQDGWDWYVDDLLALVAGNASMESVAEPASVLGALVARMHLAFAQPDPGAPAAAPLTLAGPDDLAAWARRASATLDEALEATAGEPGDRLRARRGAARSVLSGLQRLVPASTPMTRIHGDLHVGQVLRWHGGYAVSDFDGNPVLPAAERGQPAPPARDVAGMLRALDHVGRIVARRTGDGSAAVVAGWIDASREAFLAAYRGALAAADALDLFDERLLPAFEVEQECRELVYAARHLPRWTYVPDAALGPLLDRVGVGVGVGVRVEEQAHRPADAAPGGGGVG